MFNQSFHNTHHTPHHTPDQCPFTILALYKALTEVLVVRKRVFKLSGMWNMWWLWWLCGGCDVARGGGNMRNLTIIDEKSCNISLEKDVFITPVINLMIFLSNQSKIYPTNGGLFFLPKSNPQWGKKQPSGLLY